MKRPPLPVVGVVLLDLLAAFSGFFVLDRIGLFAALAEFVFFATLALGLWHLKKWAWLVELSLSVFQVALLCIGVLIALYGDRATGELYAYLVGLILLNALVVITLVQPKIRAEFV
jgi:hypothetical protein